MKATSTIQLGIEVVRVFDDEGRTKNYALRAVDGRVKEATVDIVMSPFNAGEAPRTYRRTVHFLGTSWTYITDANGVMSSQNLGVVAVRGVREEWTTGKVRDGVEFVSRVREEGEFFVMSVLLNQPITNLVLEVGATLEGQEVTARTIVSGIEGLIDVAISQGRPPTVLQAFGSDLSVS
ncbi:hypothetical protein [Actibacterium sp. 188UL27-1]|uniref:hypothetical protein n=1 Tax=Actibacterium sp. 188UL27-1 TaxID=2786961 RepID=UPI00195A2B19|nr:hypothetical protein [Actibacterium sp. 188UL27-1]MBM7070345.1 hypothetical protein [Actibacterium sp. 188UL27-1]